MKPQTAYAIKDADDHFYLRTVSYSKRRSIKLFMESDSRTWNAMYKKGYRCVKVNIIEVTK